MWEPVSLPYKSDTHILHLPSTEEIRACQHLLHQRHGSKIVALNDQIVAKYGGDLDPLEGQSLIYLEKHVPDVPAPRLYAMYYDSGELFMLMERVRGVALDRLWAELTNGEKDAVSAQLRRIFERLRRVEPPQPYFFGGLDNGPVRHYLFYAQRGEERHLGPFNGAAAFVKGLTDNLRALKEVNDHSDLQVRFYESNLQDALRDLRPVLTHGDFQRKNIMIAEKPPKQTNGERSFDLVLVDWEMAGWLPEFWEYFCASTSFRLTGWDDDWCWHVGNIIPVRLAETAVMHTFDKDRGF